MSVSRGDSTTWDHEYAKKVADGLVEFGRAIGYVDPDGPELGAHIDTDGATTSDDEIPSSQARPNPVTPPQSVRRSRGRSSERTGASERDVPPGAPRKHGELVEIQQQCLHKLRHQLIAVREQLRNQLSLSIRRHLMEEQRIAAIIDELIAIT